ncbi:MAG: DUF945 family protein [Gammaproteobacteria bacterium]|nr:DUF945 family protein [Gammaproteobacteria bacterium]
MNKKISGLIVVLFLLLLLTPFLIGVIFKQNYNKAFKPIFQNLNLSAQLLEYKRSWFFSDVIIASHFPLADQANNTNNHEESVVISQRIYHGPIIFTKGYPRIKLAWIYIDSYVDQKTHFAKTTLTLNRTLSTELALDEYALIHNNKLLYSLKGLKGDIVIDSHDMNLTSNIRFNHIFANIDSAREISKFNATIDLTKNQSGLWTGKQVYHFGELKWLQGNTVYNFHAFNYKITNALHHEHYDTKIDLDMAALLVNKLDYGAQKISIELNQLKPSELALLQHNQFSSLQTPSQMLMYQHDFMELLNKGAELKINNIHLNTLKGPINVQGCITCPCNNNACNLSSLFSKLTGNIKGQVPTDVANSFLTNSYFHFLHGDEFMAEWRKKGWLQTSGEYFLINCQF